jgi:hypothetical protein
VVNLPAGFLAGCAEEVEIEVLTTRPDGSSRRTIIWSVVADGVPYLRSYRGPHGKWYQEALVQPAVTLVVNGRETPVRVVPATDPASVTACSLALALKYVDDPSLPAMLVDDVLPTTLRVEPR